MRLIGVVAFADYLSLDDRIGGGLIGCLRITTLKLRQNVHTFNHPAKARVLAVEVRSLLESQEELRSAGITAGVRHAQATLKMTAILGLIIAFAVNVVTGAARTIPLRVAALSHKVLQDAVET